METIYLNLTEPQNGLHIEQLGHSTCTRHYGDIKRILGFTSLSHRIVCTHSISQKTQLILRGSHAAISAMETWISNCNSYIRVALIPIVGFILWVYLITLNPNQDLLLCKKLNLMHNGTQKSSLMHNGTYFPSSKAADSFQGSGLIRSWS